ncbi:hypothetical protein UPYG_G00239310 [Umbra pygmaea]|uniref:Uncharacterized protein n=1 Tax=Umbra pygmaea TaxID=75934 RepID=A0ABD0WGJ1_UMBPY
MQRSGVSVLEVSLKGVLLYRVWAVGTDSWLGQLDMLCGVINPATQADGSRMELQWPVITVQPARLQIVFIL